MFVSEDAAGLVHEALKKRGVAVQEFMLIWKHYLNPIAQLFERF